MSPHLSRDQWSRLEICLLHSWRQSVQSLIDSISQMYIFAWLFSLVLLLLVMCNLMSAVSSKKKVCCFSDSARCQSKSFSFFSSQPHLVSKAKGTIDFGGLNKWLYSQWIKQPLKKKNVKCNYVQGDGFISLDLAAPPLPPSVHHHHQAELSVEDRENRCGCVVYTKF